MENEMTGFRKHLLAGLAFALASPASLMAQDSAPETPPAAAANAEEAADNEIVVQGYTEKQVRNFLWRAVIETGSVIAKRSGPICVGIDNAPDALAQPLRARIEANLKSLKIETLPKGCRANSLVVFDRDAHRFVNWLDGQNAGVAFGALYQPEKRRLIDPVRPVYNWHVLQAEGTTPLLGAGQALSRQGAADTSFQGAEFDPGGRILAGSEPADSKMTFSVVDFDAVDGITIEQLGDYLTMQMLVEFRPDMGDSVPPDSILNLFTATGSDPDAAPEMSALDRTILTEIYSGRGSFRPGAVRAAIARESINRLEETGALIEKP
jgi:hypothetical protein